MFQLDARLQKSSSTFDIFNADRFLNFEVTFRTHLCMLSVSSYSNEELICQIIISLEWTPRNTAPKLGRSPTFRF